jgi:hypothetical protein
MSSQGFTKSEGRITVNEYSVQKEMKRNKAIPDTGFVAILSFETLSLSHCLDNRFIVDG